MQTSAMKVCFQIAECSLSSAKIKKYRTVNKLFGSFLSKKSLILARCRVSMSYYLSTFTFTCL